MQTRVVLGLNSHVNMKTILRQTEYRKSTRMLTNKIRTQHNKINKDKYKQIQTDSTPPPPSSRRRLLAF